MSFDSITFLSSLPHSPGVYRMLDDKARVIYVGKAKNLKNRVSSYFRKNVDSVKTRVMVAQIADIQITITANEVDALLLEANLIKQHHPRYNILLRDDKSYPYLFLSTKHDFPRLDYHRGAKKAAGRYFGPYPNTGSVRQTLALLQKLFKLRQCSDSFFSHRSRPCLQYQIKRCTAPCVDLVNKEDYQQQVEHATLFLQGKSNIILQELADKMEAAAKQLHYEKAVTYRDKITRLRQLQAQQVITGGKGDVDIVGVAASTQQVAIAVVYIRAGHMLGNKTFILQKTEGDDTATVLSTFISQYYLSAQRGDVIPEKIILAEAPTDQAWLQAALRVELHQKLQLLHSRRGQYGQWIDIANLNAKHHLAQHVAAKNTATYQMQALQKVLDLPNAVRRIECFDISHTQGEATVASCVVFNEEGAAKSDYRRFNIKNITPGDDYAAMQQVLTRRYTRLKESDAELPNLILIDGGKGQLQQAVDVLEELQINDVLLLGIAKGPGRKAGLEQLFLHGRAAPIKLAADNTAFHLLQHIRDEAHRFAITGHRKQRAKARQQSTLEQIAGIGVNRRRGLLRHFGGIQEIKNASMDELAKAPGISKKMAEVIYKALAGGV